MRALQFLALAFNAVAAISVAHTARAAAAPNDVWTGLGEFGAVLDRGNVNTETANAKLDLKQTAGSWAHELSLAGIYGRNAGEPSAENVDASWQSNYTVGNGFAFGAARDLIDKFSGFEYQASVTLGMGYRLINEARMKLSAQIGYGLLRQRSQVLSKSSTGAVIGRHLGPAGNSGNVAGKISFERDFLRASKLTDVLGVMRGGGNTAIQDVAELQVKMSTALALGLGFTIRHNSNPPRGSVATDTITTVNLVYAF